VHLHCILPGFYTLPSTIRLPAHFTAWFARFHACRFYYRAFTYHTWVLLYCPFPPHTVATGTISLLLRLFLHGLRSYRRIIPHAHRSHLWFTVRTVHARSKAGRRAYLIHCITPLPFLHCATVPCTTPGYRFVYVHTLFSPVPFAVCTRYTLLHHNHTAVRSFFFHGSPCCLPATFVLHLSRITTYILLLFTVSSGCRSVTDVNDFVAFHTAICYTTVLLVDTFDFPTTFTYYTDSRYYIPLYRSLNFFDHS